MLNPVSLQLRVGVDVGSRCHTVAIGLSDGSLLEEFDILHTAEGFREFFTRVEACGRRHAAPIAVAMEGYNGHVRPLDSLVRARGWQLFNVNNLKLARFKEIFPAAAKSDRIDTRKTLELFQLRDHLPMAGEVLQEVLATPEENNVLKRLSRRRRRLVNERGRVANALQADLQAVCPGLLEITREAGNLWFLNFLTCRKGLLKLARVRRASLLKVPGIGDNYASAIQAWQSRAYFASDASLVGDMIQQDAARILELKLQIKALEEKMAYIAERSSIACRFASIPGYGSICSAELAGEIGTVKRFRHEASLALYLGMATLDRSSGKSRGSKPPRHVNARAKAAMMIAVDHHRKLVPQSQRYYEKKRAESKTHNQAIRALGRHLCRVIFKMLTQDRPYRIDTSPQTSKAS
ncbi:MAG: IS110 family transposase [Paracoccaceae bacterium]|jgi:transposase|nr:IS110 family transposase [Paracoccaceae bacterium]HJO97240.1 IS110 family transposase [Rhodospirillales bacterium]